MKTNTEIRQVGLTTDEMATVWNSLLRSALITESSTYRQEELKLACFLAAILGSDFITETIQFTAKHRPALLGFINRQFV